jgi:LacI family transcriptional regulator
MPERAIGGQSQESGSRRIGIEDIAKEAGVSIATVSRVLNGRPDVADSTRARVMNYVREHSYSDARAAPRRSSRPLGLVGVTVPAIRGSYFSEILAGIIEGLDGHGAQPVISEASRTQEREDDVLKRFGPGTVDGLILVVPRLRTGQLNALLLREYPVVVVDPLWDVPSTIPVVTSTHLNGARDATDHLLDLGHTRIGLITGPSDGEATRLRLEGVQFSYYKRRLTPDDRLSVVSDYTFEGGYEAAHTLLKSASPTAIFCFNDGMAAGAIRAAVENGLTLPRDLSIVGFDNAETAQFVTPALTTVMQPLMDLGRTAVTTLYRMRESQQVQTTRIELSTSLILRKSTAPPRSP